MTPMSFIPIPYAQTSNPKSSQERDKKHLSPAIEDFKDANLNAPIPLSKAKPRLETLDLGAEEVAFLLELDLEDRGLAPQTQHVADAAAAGAAAVAVRGRRCAGREGQRRHGACGGGV